MTSKKKKPSDGELNYWESISDVMAALLLVVLLVMMLFILYMTRMPDVDIIDEFYTSADDGHYDTADDDDTWGKGIYWLDREGRYEHEGDDDGRGQGTGDGTGSGAGNDAGRYPYENYGEGDWEGDQKAAVYVTVLDGGTGLTVKEAGITFQLYHARTGLKTLYSYYPEHQKYDTFATMQGGSFYLPEKIGLGSYHFSELSVPYGYDLSEDIHFDLDQSYDWDDPYHVIINIFPCRNVIRVQNVDEATSSKVPYGAYQVIAASDVITADGTLRYAAGEVVDTIECDETGYGESAELYIGEYTVRQLTAPTYYAASHADTIVQLPRKDEDTDHIVTEMPQQRTVYALQLHDELYESHMIAGASFELTQTDGTPVQDHLETDAQGCITLNELRSDTGYKLTQTGAPDGYQLLEEPLTFIVSADGRIEGDPNCIKDAANRKLRVSIGVSDILFGSEVSGVNLALYDEHSDLVLLWTSSALPEEFDFLVPAAYRVMINGSENQVISLNVENVKEIQTFTLPIWSTVSLAAVGGAALAVSVFGGLTVWLIIRRRRNANEKEHANHDQ